MINTLSLLSEKIMSLHEGVSALKKRNNAPASSFLDISDNPSIEMLEKVEDNPEGSIGKLLGLSNKLLEKFSQPVDSKIDIYLKLALKAIKDIEQSLFRNESFLKLSSLSGAAKLNLKLAYNEITKLAMDNPALANEYHKKLKKIHKKLALYIRKIKEKNKLHMSTLSPEQKSRKHENAMQEAYENALVGYGITSSDINNFRKFRM